MDAKIPTDTWLVVWRGPPQGGWWRPRRHAVHSIRLPASGRDDALRQAAAEMAGGQFLFAASRRQIERGLSALVPRKTQSESRYQEAMLSWLPMVAPEFVVLSSLGGDTHAHPVRAGCVKSALTTWEQCYQRHLPIACAPREEWERVRDWLSGEIDRLVFSKDWAAQAATWHA